MKVEIFPHSLFVFCKVLIKLKRNKTDPFRMVVSFLFAMEFCYGVLCCPWFTPLLIKSQCCVFCFVLYERWKENNSFSYFSITYYFLLPNNPTKILNLSLTPNQLTGKCSRISCASLNSSLENSDVINGAGHGQFIRTPHEKLSSLLCCAFYTKLVPD